MKPTLDMFVPDKYDKARIIALIRRLQLSLDVAQTLQPLAKGDLIYADTSTTLDGLAIGSAGQILRSTGTLPAWSTLTFPNTITRGGLFYGSASNVASVLAIGTATHVLTSDGTDVSWAAPAVPTTVTVADTNSATTYVGLFESATGNLGPKTDPGITYNASNTTLTVATVVGNLTGNADTVTTEGVDGDTQTLLHLNGSDGATTFTDNGLAPVTWTAQGNAQLDTAKAKFGPSSLLLDGTGDYLTATLAAGLPSGSAGWTVEGWWWFAALPSGNRKGLFGLDSFVTQLGINSSDKLVLCLGDTGGGWFVIDSAGSTTITTGQWYHVALTRDKSAGKYYLYLNGVKEIEVTSASDVVLGTSFWLGRDLQGVYTNGWIDDFRIAHSCKYPGGTTFTPPTTQFGNPASITYPMLATSATGSLSPATNSGLSYDPETATLTTTTFAGSLTGSITGNAATVTVADAGGDTTCSVLLATDATGSLSPRTDSGITYNASTNALTTTTFIGALTGNASTATALQTPRTIGGTSFDGTANIVPATITVADTTDSTCWVAVFESQTGDLAPKTDGGLTYNASTGMLTATGFTGPLTGNADTVTWANEATDTTCFIGFATAASGSLAPKTNVNMTFNSNTGVATFASVVLTTADINGGTIDGAVIGGSSAAAITGTTITVNTSLLPDANDGAVLGASGNAFSDLFLASGAVIDFAAGNSVITHSSAVLTVSTGDLRVTTAGTNSASVVTVGGTQTLTAKTLTAPDINGGTADSLTSFSIRSTGAAFDLLQATSEAISANRTISWSVGNADRTITLSGNPTLNDWFNQSVKTSASPTFAAVTLGAGSAGAPTLTFGDATTGFYRSAADELALSVAGADNMTLTSGRVLFGSTVSYAAASGTPGLQRHGLNTNASAFGIYGWSSVTTQNPHLQGVRSLSGTVGSHTTVADGQDLFLITGAGSDGTSFFSAVQLLMEAESTITTGIVPGRYTIKTANQSGVLTDWFQINSAGDLRQYAINTSATSYSRLVHKFATTTLASVSGATVTATSLIPAKASVAGVNTKVTVALGTGGGTTGYKVGDGTDDDRWGAVTGTATTTDTDGSDATADPAGTWSASARNVVITAVGGNFNGTGSIRVDVFYWITEAD